MTEFISKERVLQALKGVKEPSVSEDIVSRGLVSEIVIHGGKVYFAISVDPARAREGARNILRRMNAEVRELPKGWVGRSKILGLLLSDGLRQHDARRQDDQHLEIFTLPHRESLHERV